MAWLAAWAKRRKITIDNNNIDSDLTHFPVPIVLGASVGQTDQDVSDIFDEIGNNSKKIAITKADGITQIYGEIECWDFTNEKAVIWVSKSDLVITSTETTELYIYFDSVQSDNTTYIGDVTDTPAQAVWDDNFKAVYHMAQDPSGGTGAIKDSTSNINHGTSSGDMTSEDLVNGFIGRAIDFDGTDDLITITGQSFNYDIVTLEGMAKTIYSGPTERYITSNVASGGYGLNREEVDGVDRLRNTMHIDGSYHNLISNASHDIVSWYNIAGRYDQITQNLFIDGVKQTDSYANTNPITDVSVDFCLGCNAPSGGQWQGPIAEIRLSNIARSDAWIKATNYSLKDDLITFSSIEIGDNININALPIEFDFSILGTFFTSNTKIITGWKKYKDLGPWEFEKSGADNRYNEGNSIQTNANPVWDLETVRGTPITKGHNPCGYWTKEYVSIPSKSEVFYSMYGTGFNNFGTLNIGSVDSLTPIFTQNTSFLSTKKWREFSLSRHILCLDENYILWSFGANSYGELGINSTSSLEIIPQQPVGTTSFKYKKLNSHLYTSAIIREDNTLWSCGWNSYYGLGLGHDTETVKIFEQDYSGKTWLDASLTYFGSLAIDTNGILWAIGAGGSAQASLGFDDQEGDRNTHIWQQVPYNNGECTKIIHEVNNSILFKGDQVYVAGNNTSGMLGLGGVDKVKRFTHLPGSWKNISITENSMVGVKTDGTLWGAGVSYKGSLIQSVPPDETYLTTLTQLDVETNWEDAYISTGSIIVLKNDGTIWAAGTNNNSNLQGMGLGINVYAYPLTQVGIDTDWIGIQSPVQNYSYAYKAVY